MEKLSYFCQIVTRACQTFVTYLFAGRLGEWRHTANALRQSPWRRNFASIQLKRTISTEKLYTHTMTNLQWYLQSSYSKTVIADRHFSCVAPHLWNSLPLHVRTASSSDIFQSQLKTHFFSVAFDNSITKPSASEHFCECCVL